MTCISQNLVFWTCIVSNTLFSFKLQPYSVIPEPLKIHAAKVSACPVRHHINRHLSCNVRWAVTINQQMASYKSLSDSTISPAATLPLPDLPKAAASSMRYLQGEKKKKKKKIPEVKKQANNKKQHTHMQGWTEKLLTEEIFVLEHQLDKLLWFPECCYCAGQ